MDIARLGNKYLADMEPWKVAGTDPERVETVMNVALQITANLAIATEPFMPFTAAKIAQMLGVEAQGWDALGRADLLAAGHVVTDAPELLFEKIEDTSIEAQIAKLEATRATKVAEAAAESAAAIEPQKPSISFDEFEKMDIRIGTILEAEAVPKTKKLLKFRIDTGIDIRTIVSGIAEHFTPEELVGRQVTVIANLAPREIKGVLSHGMILMTERADGKFVMIPPTEKVPNGKTVN
jgi:methionyl-tRNA synthetase